MNEQTKDFLTKTTKAIADFHLIEPGDSVAVGVSGGKDSTALLLALSLYRHKYRNKIPFNLQAIHLDMGWQADLSPLKNYCERLEIPLTVEYTQIGTIVFDIRQEKNPCSLCANLRRGALNNKAIDLGCHKVALAHHLDDTMETYLMSLLFTGNMKTFRPKSFLDRSGITLIRPLIYLPEADIISLVEQQNLPVIYNPCPANKKTKREEVKTLVNRLAEQFPDIRAKFLTSLLNFDPANLWPPREGKKGRWG